MLLPPLDHVQELLLAVDVHLLVDVAQVGGHRAARQVEVFLDAGARAALREQDHDLGFLG